MKKLKDIDYKILFELIKNSKISDRKLARVVGVSQPTVTRRRARLENKKLLDYTAIPNLEKLGIEIMAFIFATGKHEVNIDKLMPQVEAFVLRNPNIIFLSSGRGLGMNSMAISLHRDYSNYVKFMRELEEEWGKHLAKLDSFIISLKSEKILRNLTFKYLEDYMKKGGVQAT